MSEVTVLIVPGLRDHVAEHWQTLPIKGPLLLVAHSGGVVMVAHWAKQTQRVVHGALLATPPDFEQAMPAGYPTIDELRAGGWLPVPRNRLPFRSIVAASRNDPLGQFERVAELAQGLGQQTGRSR
jgi:predicted alpha/beta hydrolase family esterase